MITTRSVLAFSFISERSSPTFLEEMANSYCRIWSVAFLFSSLRITNQDEHNNCACVLGHLSGYLHRQLHGIGALVDESLTVRKAFTVISGLKYILRLKSGQFIHVRCPKVICLDFLR